MSKLIQDRILFYGGILLFSLGVLAFALLLSDLDALTVLPEAGLVAMVIVLLSAVMCYYGRCFMVESLLVSEK